MPHVTEHTPKVSTRSVKPYACESSREKRQQDRQTARQTDRQTHRRIVQNHFSRRFGGCTSQIRSYLEVDFLHDANTSIDMEIKTVPSLTLLRLTRGKHHPKPVSFFLLLFFVHGLPKSPILPCIQSWYESARLYFFWSIIHQAFKFRSWLFARRRKYMETWTHVMQFKWEVTWTHGTPPNTSYVGKAVAEYTLR